MAKYRRIMIMLKKIMDWIHNLFIKKEPEKFWASEEFILTESEDNPHGNS